jgi:hypothetical protein
VGEAFAEGTLAGAVSGCGQGEEVLLEHRPGGAVDGEPAAHLAVPVVPDGQPGGRGGVAFLAFEERGFVGVGGLGGGDLEGVSAQVLEGLGVVVGGLLEQVPLGLVDQVGVEVGGEVGQGAEDGLGLLHVDPALGQRGPGVLALLEPVGEPHRPMRRRSGGSRLVGVPVRGRGRAGGGGQVDPVGVRQEPGLELGQLGSRGLDLGEGGRWSRWRPSTRPAPRPPRRADRAHPRAPGRPGAAGGRALSWALFQHRPPTLARGRDPCVDNGFECPGCGRKLAIVGGCGGFVTVAARRR